MATSAFVGASLQQLIAAARLPNTGISEIVVNASWRSFRAPSPGMIPSAPSPFQMARTHSAAMAVLNGLA